MRVLTFTTLYPNAEQPNHGLFVEHRLRQLVGSGAVEAEVVAPVPWFPSTNARFGRYATFARVPDRESRHGLAIRHPRFPVIPKVGMWAAPYLLYRATLPTVRAAMRAGFDFDLIDAHFFYPDGVAATMIGQALGKPVVVTARGSDITRYREYPGPRRRIVRAARRAAAIVTVSQALNDAVVALGVPADHVHTMRNGVDLDLFRPLDGAAARARRELDGRVLLSVGNLLANKGHDIAIRALPELPEVTLVIIGDGPERSRLASVAAAHGVEARVRFVAPIPQEDLREYYALADATVLCSEREGWPNVLLESMACATPVVATDVWGIPEIVRAPAAGRLMSERSPEALVAAARELFAEYPERCDTRRYAERFSWEATSRAQAALFQAIAGSDAAHTASVRVLPMLAPAAEHGARGHPSDGSPAGSAQCDGQADPTGRHSRE